MPLYRVAWRQAHDATFATRRRWSNVLYTNAPSSVAAAAAGVVAWETWLRNAQSQTIFCYEVYATDLTVGTEDYTVQAVPSGLQRGSIAPNTGERYMPKVCSAVTLNVPGSRPSRKFWRMDLRESDITEGTILNVNYINGITAAFNALLGDVAAIWTDPDGQVLTSTGRIRLTTREFGRESTVDVPQPPAVG